MFRCFICVDMVVLWHGVPPNTWVMLVHRCVAWIMVWTIL